MKYKAQVQPNHYSQRKYLSLERWISYFHQIKLVNEVSETLKKRSLKILEIGIGDGTVSNYLKNNGHEVTTMDLDIRLKPDVTAVLPNIPTKTKFDCIVCCEVLEHLKYEDSILSLENMSKLTKHIVLSVPHKSLYLSLGIRISLLKVLKMLVQIPTPFILHKFDGEHYWELGTAGCSKRKLLEDMSSIGIGMSKEFRVPEYPYHHFFLLKCN
jgi:2-polyprenyl-3-methyl-5-hydroxy-6-metoxy-1,4-benzoquinol methylase